MNIDDQMVSVTLPKRVWDEFLTYNGSMNPFTGSDNWFYLDEIADAAKTALIEQVEYPREVLTKEPGDGTFVVDSEDDVLVRVSGKWIVVAKKNGNISPDGSGRPWQWYALDKPMLATDVEIDAALRR